MSIYSIGPAESWVVDRAEVSGAELDLFESPYFYPLVDYQDKVETGVIKSFYRTVQCIKDASRVEDASLITHELDADNEQIVIHHLRIIRDGQTIDALDTENIKVMQREMSLQRHITNDRWTITVSIEDLRAGDTIDFSCTIIESANKHPLKGKQYRVVIWLNWVCPVHKEYFRVINDSTQTLLLSERRTTDDVQKTAVQEIAPGMVFDQCYENVTPVDMDDAVPGWVWCDHIEVAMKQSWQDISTYLYNSYADNNDGSNPLELTELDQLVLSGDVAEDIISIVRFVQNDVRYRGEHNGIYSHTPRNAATTLKKRAGDCKDKSNLLVEMLKTISVKSRLVLVNTSTGRGLINKAPSAYHFNHMIVEVEYEGKLYYFDPTIQKQKGNLQNITEFFYGFGLPIDESGAGLVEIPINLNKLVFKLHHQFDFTELRINHAVGRLTINRTYFAHRADNVRFHVASKESNKLEQDFLSYSKTDTELELEIIEGFHIVSDDEQNNVLTTQEIYSISDINISHKRKNVDLPTEFVKELPTQVSGKYPILLNLDGNLEHIIDVDYRKAHGVAPTQKTIRNDYFEYSDEIIKTKNQFTFISRIKLLDDVVKAEDVDAYVEDVNEVYHRSNNSFPWQIDVSGYFEFFVMVVVIAAILLAIYFAYS